MAIRAKKLNRITFGITRAALSPKRYSGKERHKKVWMNCVKYDVNKKGMNPDMTNDGDEWRKRT